MSCILGGPRATPDPAGAMEASQLKKYEAGDLSATTPRGPRSGCCGTGTTLVVLDISELPMGPPASGQTGACIWQIPIKRSRPLGVLSRL